MHVQDEITSHHVIGSKACVGSVTRQRHQATSEVTATQITVSAVMCRWVVFTGEAACSSFTMRALLHFCSLAAACKENKKGVLAAVADAGSVKGLALASTVTLLGLTEFEGCFVRV